MECSVKLLCGPAAKVLAIGVSTNLTISIRGLRQKSTGLLTIEGKWPMTAKSCSTKLKWRSVLIITFCSFSGY